MQRLLSLLLVFGFASTAFAQRELKDIPDPDPELERATFQVAEGFEVNLFAADPAIAKPIQMNFDAQGRLWIASSEIYPHIQPGQPANDKILVLEDRDGDGVSDETTVFADGLLIPTGVEPGDGGAYVANSTELLHLADTDGDGRADARRTVLSGFGTEDTHHILHTLRWGPDGCLYMNQSIYIHSHIETPHGVRRLGGGGIWQFRPETYELEIFCRGFVNPWGHHFDAWGQSFATDGAYGEGINYVFPGSVWVTAPGATRIVKGLNPGSPKHCGLEIVDGRHLPEEWRGNAISNDFRAHRVCRFVLSEDGSGYASREQTELIETDHVAFRPIDVKMGPDGAIYIADWYNPIIQHGEVDFRDPRRDHTHGRIWRVTAKGRPLVERPQLVGASVEALLEYLKAPEYFTRHHAKRQLKERGADAVLPALAAWVAGMDESADPADEHHRLEALWTYRSLDVVEPALLGRLLGSVDHRVRAAAVRVLSAWQDRLSLVDEGLARAATDEHGRVRLEAIRALAARPSAPSAQTALHALDRPLDDNLDFALWQAMRDLEPHWLPALRDGELDFGGDARKLAFALEASGSPAVVEPLMDLVRSGRVPPEREEGVLSLIASLGGPNELAAIFDLVVTDENLAVERRAGLLTALANTSQRRKVQPAADLVRLDGLLSANDAALQAAALRAAGIWKVADLRPKLVSAATGEDTPAALRRAAIDALAHFGGEDDRAVLDQLASAEPPSETRLLAAMGLQGLDLELAARRAVELLASADGTLDVAPLYAGFLARKGGPEALTAALAGAKLPPDAAKIGIRAARTAPQPFPDLVAALSAAAGLTGGTTTLSAAELEQLIAEVRTAGDPARGEVVFRRADQACLKCHAIAGAGGRVGPDLLSVGASAQVDYLVESILEPSKKVKENYHSVVVEDDDGLVHTGLKVRESATELVLRDAEDREVAIPVEAIVEQAPGGSIMPVGLADTLTRAELIDLVRFLSELGKPGPYAAGTARVVRRWEAAIGPAPGEPEEALLARDDSRIAFAPLYSNVSGELPIDSPPAFQLPRARAYFSIVRFQLDVTSPGAVRLLLNSDEWLNIHVDGRLLPASSDSVRDTDFTFDLDRGRHTIDVFVDRAVRRQGLRVELADPPQGGAQVQIVTGK